MDASCFTVSKSLIPHGKASTHSCRALRVAESPATNMTDSQSQVGPTQPARLSHCRSGLLTLRHDRKAQILRVFATTSADLARAERNTYRNWKASTANASKLVWLRVQRFRLPRDG